jgi:hypothetical protein
MAQIDWPLEAGESQGSAPLDTLCVSIGPDPSAWFRRQLEAGCESLVWAVRQAPIDRLHASPPVKLGEWSLVRHAFHALYYEREVALPSVRHWLGEHYPSQNRFVRSCDPRHRCR